MGQDEKEADTALTAKIALKKEMERKVESLTRSLKEERRKKESVEELLVIAEATSAKTRERLRQSEEVLSIPSKDIHLTDKKLGSGSYGGEMFPSVLSSVLRDGSFPK